MTLANVRRIALDLLYPPRCAVCGSNGSLVCEGCLGELPRTVGQRCDVCWLRVRDGISCHACAAHPLVLQRLRAALRYDGQVRHLVRAFKFTGQSSLAPSLARPLHETYVAHELSADVVVPVPLTGLGKRMRGYNQAALLANELAKATGVPYAEALSRKRSVKDQARSTSAEERRRNVVGAFAVRKREAVADRTVLLIDDVATTGATLDACARELLAAGATCVSALTLARED